MPPTFLELEHTAAASGWTEALSWTLLHSIWIAACAAVLLGAVLRLVPTRFCRWRYALSIAALLLVPLFVLGALAREGLANHAIEWVSTEAAPASPPLWQQGFEALRQAVELLRLELALRLEPFERWIAAAWLACVVAALARLAGGWAWLRHERRSSQRRAAPSEQVRLARLGRRAGLRQRVPLYWSSRCEVPMVVGARQPRIVIPARLRSALQRGELDAVLLHELAHVRRGDPWLRLFEALLQALFVPNLALHAIAARIEREREHCCDERALRLGADRLGYVRALAALELSRQPARKRPPRMRLLQLLSSHALRATDGALLERIQRMSGCGQAWSRRRSLAACAALLLGLCGLGLGAVPTHVPATLLVGLQSTGSAEFEWELGSQDAPWIGALPHPPGAWKERVIVLAHPQGPQRVAGARAARVRIEATTPALRVRGARSLPRTLRGEHVELRWIEAAR